MPSPLDPRQALADLGLDISDLRSAPEVIEQMRRGILCQVSVHAWSATARLDESDLGLNLGPETPHLGHDDPLRLGAKRLLPRKLDQQLATTIRNLRDTVYDRAFKTAWGYFIPVTAYARWREVFEERQAAFFALRDRLVRDYDLWRDEIANEYQGVARAAYWRAKRLYPSLAVTEEDYVRRYLEAILAHIPAPEALAAEFTCTAIKTFIPLEDYLNTPLPAEAPDDPQTEMERDVLGEAQATGPERLVGFVRDVTAPLCSLIHEVAMAALASIGKQEHLGSSSARSLRNLVCRFRELNFLENQELEVGINQLDLLMGQDPKDRPLAELTAVLQDLAAVALAGLVKFGEQPRVGRDLGLAPLPEAAPITRVRRDPGLFSLNEQAPPALTDPLPTRQPRLAPAC